MKPSLVKLSTTAALLMVLAGCDLYDSSEAEVDATVKTLDDMKSAADFVETFERRIKAAEPVIAGNKDRLEAAQAAVVAAPAKKPNVIEKMTGAGMFEDSKEQKAAQKRRDSIFQEDSEGIRPAFIMYALTYVVQHNEQPKLHFPIWGWDTEKYLHAVSRVEALLKSADANTVSKFEKLKERFSNAMDAFHGGFLGDWHGSFTKEGDE